MTTHPRLFNPATASLIAAVLCFATACATLRAYLPGGGGQEPFSTTIEDAPKDRVEADALPVPKKAQPMDKQPRKDDGSYQLKPGYYETELDSFCMYPGKAPAGKGTAYLPAPYKGPKAEMLRGIITRWRAFPDKIGKSDAQALLWAILTRTKIKDASPTVKKAASALLSKADIDGIDGASLGVLGEKTMIKVMQQIPPELRDAYRKQNELRAKFADASASYEELEKLAVPPSDDPGQALGTWTRMPEGHLIRYLPNGYQNVRVEVFIPKPVAVFDPFRLDSLLAQPAAPNPIGVDPSDQVATPTSGQRLAMTPPKDGPAEKNAVAGSGSSGGSDAGSSGGSSSGSGSGSTASGGSEGVGDPTAAGTDVGNPGGGGPPAGKPTATPKGAIEKDDPCFGDPYPQKPSETRPDEQRCPLSARAWDIRQSAKVGVQAAVAVSKGTVVIGGKSKAVVLVTTNDATVHGALKPHLKSNETLGPLPGPRDDANKGPKEHAEDVAVRWFKENKVDTSKGKKSVEMGSDPKGCQWCSAQYKNHPWVKHERLIPYVKGVPTPADLK